MKNRTKKDLDWLYGEFEMPDQNRFDIADWVAIYGVKFPDEQLGDLIQFPWDLDVLESSCSFCGKKVKNCHFAFAGFDQLNILKLQELHPAKRQPYFYSYFPDSWYSKEEFAEGIIMQPRWYLLHIGIVPGSEGKTFDQQKVMLPAEYKTPRALSEAAKNLLLFKKTGVFANPSRCSRCADLTSGDRRVFVGEFADADVGLPIDRCSDTFCSALLGIGAERKLPGNK